jgi:hypothetical protein
MKRTNKSDSNMQHLCIMYSISPPHTPTPVPAIVKLNLRYILYLFCEFLLDLTLLVGMDDALIPLCRSKIHT